MIENLLVFTPDLTFGGTIRSPLQDTGSFRVHVVNNKSAAVVSADELACKMAFLDLQLGDQWIEEIGQSLRTVIPDIQLFMLADNETPPVFDSIRPWTLRKTFNMPDLFNSTSKLPQ